jgi:hypothetical protein
MASFPVEWMVPSPSGGAHFLPSEPETTVRTAPISIDLSGLALRVNPFATWRRSAPF